jgi:tetratricopeptide (TPR) repeat protein
VIERERGRCKKGVSRLIDSLQSRLILGDILRALKRALRKARRRKRCIGEQSGASTHTGEYEQPGGCAEGPGRYEEAEEMHGQALRLQEMVLGKEHPSTLRSMNNLAGVLRDQGNYEDAEEIYFILRLLWASLASNSSLEYASIFILA